MNVSKSNVDGTFNSIILIKVTENSSSCENLFISKIYNYITN